MVFKFPKVSMVQKGTVLVLRFFFCFLFCFDFSMFQLLPEFKQGKVSMLKKGKRFISKSFCFLSFLFILQYVPVIA